MSFVTLGLSALQTISALVVVAPPEPPKEAVVYNPAIEAAQLIQVQTVDECVAQLPPGEWTKRFCDVAVQYHEGRFSHVRFATNKRFTARTDAARVLLSDRERAFPYRLELGAVMLFRDLDGMCLADDFSLSQDMDAWWGTVAQRNVAVSEIKSPIGPCSRWESNHTGWDSLHIMVVDLTQVGTAELFGKRSLIPHELPLWPDQRAVSAEAWFDMARGLWGLSPYPAMPRGNDTLVWDTRESGGEGARAGESWQRQYAEDKFLKGVINLGVVELLKAEETKPPLSPFADPVRLGRLNHTLVQGLTISDNGKYEFGDFRTFGPQWVDYTPGYDVLDLQPGHEYGVVVFGSDGGRLLNHDPKVKDVLRGDPDDVVAIRRIRPDEIRDGTTITMYERPRVKILSDGTHKDFPPAGVVTLRVWKQ